MQLINHYRNDQLFFLSINYKRAKNFADQKPEKEPVLPTRGGPGLGKNY